MRKLDGTENDAITVHLIENEGVRREDQENVIRVFTNLSDRSSIKRKQQ